MSANWNPWHGCHKYSEGCKNCYVFRGDAKYDRDTENIIKTQSFNMPVAKNRKGEYKMKIGEMVWLCFSSDFFLEDADIWRQDAWKMIKERSDCEFLFITKRILRFYDCIPPDWGDGYENVIFSDPAHKTQMYHNRAAIRRNGFVAVLVGKNRECSGWRRVWHKRSSMPV